MANNVIRFPLEQRTPILTRRWRTIVDVQGTRYALDITAAYSLLAAAPVGELPEKSPPSAVAAKPAARPLRGTRTRRSQRDGN